MNRIWVFPFHFIIPILVIKDFSKMQYSFFCKWCIIYGWVMISDVQQNWNRFRTLETSDIFSFQSLRLPCVHELKLNIQISAEAKDEEDRAF